MSNFTRVYFPGLGIDFDLPSVAFTIGSYDIHFYGIIIAFGFMLAVLYGGRIAYKWRMSLDGMTPSEASLLTGEIRKRWTSYREKAIKEAAA